MTARARPLGAAARIAVPFEQIKAGAAQRAATPRRHRHDPPKISLRRVLDVLDHTQSGHRLGIGHRRDRAPEDGPVGDLPAKSDDFVLVQMTRLTSGGKARNSMNSSMNVRFSPT